MASQAPPSERLRQLSRIFQTPISGDTQARAEISARAPEFAEALLREAAASDDVTSPESALAYFDSRLAYFAGLVSVEAAAVARTAFAARVSRWA